MLPRRLLDPPPPGLEVHEERFAASCSATIPITRASASRSQGALQARREMPAAGANVVDEILDRSAAATVRRDGRFRRARSHRRDRAHPGRGRRHAGRIPRLVGRRDPHPQSVPHAGADGTFVASANALSAYMRELIDAAPRKKPKTISSATWSHAAGRRRAAHRRRDSFNNLQGLLLVGGNLTTTDLIGNGSGCS
jgi:hypothetical protein